MDKIIDRIIAAVVHELVDEFFRADIQHNFIWMHLFDLISNGLCKVGFPQPGYLMLCSDGLWGVVSEQDIVRSINESPTLQRACQNLTTAANLAGGPDNISVVLVQLIG